MGTYWSQGIEPENFIFINPIDAVKYSLKDGDTARIISRSNPEGVWELGNGESKYVEGLVKVTECIMPGVITGPSNHYGHWAYGAMDIEIDGKIVKADPRRGKGICANTVCGIDAYNKNTPWTDPIGASAVFNYQPVKLVKIK